MQCEPLCPSTNLTSGLDDLDASLAQGVACVSVVGGADNVPGREDDDVAGAAGEFPQGPGLGVDSPRPSTVER